MLINENTINEVILVHTGAEVRECHLLRRKSWNKILRVKTDSQSYIVKVYNKSKDEDIDIVNGVLNAASLRATEDNVVAIASPMQRQDGNFVTIKDGYYFAVYTDFGSIKLLKSEKSAVKLLLWFRNNITSSGLLPRYNPFALAPWNWLQKYDHIANAVINLEIGHKYCSKLEYIAQSVNMYNNEKLVVSHGDFKIDNLGKCLNQYVILDLDNLYYSHPEDDASMLLLSMSCGPKIERNIDWNAWSHWLKVIKGLDYDEEMLYKFAICNLIRLSAYGKSAWTDIRIGIIKKILYNLY